MADRSLSDQLQTALGDAYTLERELGGGGMSRVFVATEKALGRQVVVKVLPPELSGGVNVERFRREITTVAKLQHPHIVPVLAAGESGGLPYFTMPYVQGESLRSRLARQGQLPLEDVVWILRDVSKALAYAHRNGVVHRDIKPDNVLVSGDSAVVTDFGVSKALAESATDGTLTSIGMALGTPAYMAPEQAAASTDIDHRVDIYALGAMAYEMIAGTSPFAGRTAQRMLSAHVLERPAEIATLREAVPPVLARLVMQCLEKDPSDRPGSADDVLKELNAIATPGGTAPYVRAGSALRERGTQMWSAVVIVAILVAIAVPQFLKYRDSATLNPRRVVVAPFTNLTGDRTLDPIGRIASDLITSGLSELDSVDVVSASAAAEVAGDSGDVVRRVSERTRAGTVVSGSYFRQGDSLRISAQVANAATGRVVQSLDPVMAATTDPITALTLLRDRLMSEVAVVDQPRSSRLQPPAYAAYREFAEGQQYFVKQNYAKAIEHFKRAIAADSNFVAPYRAMAGAYFNMGNLRADDSITTLLLARRGRLRGDELLTADALDARYRRDTKAELEVQRRIAARDSTPGAVYLVGWSAIHNNRPHEAMAAFANAEQRDFAWPPLYQFHAYAHHFLGDHRSELKVIQRGRRVSSRPSLLNAELRALAALGDVKRVHALLDSIKDVQMDSGFTQAGTMRTAAHELRAHGRPAEAQELYERAVLWYYEDAARRPPTSARWRLIAHAHYDAGQFDSAQAVAQRRLRVDTASVDMRGLLGAIAARRGDTVTAMQTIEWLEHVKSRYPDAAPKPWQARIYALLGKKAEAVEALRQSFTRPTYFGDWVHRTWEFESLRDYPAYVEVLRPKG